MAVALLFSGSLMANDTAGVDYETNLNIVSALALLGFLLAVGIIVIGYAIKAVATSASDRLDRTNTAATTDDNDADAGSGAGTAGKIVGALVLLLTLPQLASATDWNNSMLAFTNSDLYWLASIDAVLLAVFWYMVNLLNELMRNQSNALATQEEVSAIESLAASLTDAVPIEEEESILFDHEYDGIQELDNNLPPWWKWGFYLTIVIAVVYLGHYHVFGTGQLQLAEYEAEVAEAKAAQEAYLDAQALNVDENSAYTLTDVSELAAGGALFAEHCVVCHGDAGQGVVGPNLTDNYWYYGNDMKSVFSTIKYGSDKGTMRSWQDELNPLQIQQVASYIQSLIGTNPAAPKDPEGEYYDPIDMDAAAAASAVIDSAATAVVDTAAVAVVDSTSATAE